MAIGIGIILVEVVLQGDCLGDVQLKLGSITVNVALTLFACFSALLYMPSGKANTPTQFLKQEFAWTEGGLESAVSLRNNQLGLERGPSRLLSRMLSGPMLRIMSKVGRTSDKEQVATKPMFCVEVAVRLYYWMRLAYQHDVPGSLLSVEEALELYELKHFDCIEEKETDSKVVFGWNDALLVVAFRGTKTVANVITDIKVRGGKSLVHC
jgi:hypothetical protein